MGFILETFLRSIRAASTHVEGLENGAVVRLLTNLIDKGWLAAVAESEGYLMGWAVFKERNHLAWIYVRDMFRRPHTLAAGMLLAYAEIDTAKPIITPFMPNRERCRWKLIHRPYECL